MRGTIITGSMELGYKYFPSENDFILESGKIDGVPMPRGALDGLERSKLRDLIHTEIVEDIRRWVEGSKAA